MMEQSIGITVEALEMVAAPKWAYLYGGPNDGVEGAWVFSFE